VQGDGVVLQKGSDGAVSQQDLSDSLSAEVLARLDAVPQLQNRLEITELSGGLTNQNLKVTTAAGIYVARLSSPESAMLNINREHEYRNSMAAAQSGAAPEVIAYAPEVSVLVVGFIDGWPWGADDVLQPANAARIATACRQLHAGPRFVNDFNMLELQPQYLSIVQERGFRLPDGYLDFTGHVQSIGDAMAAHPLPTVPCNNDLLAANFIDDGQRVWVIDYEYAGNNDPFFEIGNIWSEATGSPDDLDRLVTAYVGHNSQALAARARLWGLMSKYGWMLWASIQEGTSTIDFDFWSWGMEKYDRVVAEFESPEFGQLLEQVRRGD